MAMIWKCENCDFSAPGTGKGSALGLAHHLEIKKGGGEKHSIVLVDEETGSPMLDEGGAPVKSLRKAQKMGFVPVEAPKDKARTRSDGPLSSTDLKTTKASRGEIKAEVVDLDFRLRFLYEWDRMMTNYEGNFGEWIWDVCMGFHIQNREVLRFDLLFAEG